ncbi:hypothetical protein Tco_0909788 [Tanacetum coccineum]|uniref:Uncharacterized protein n=1 Tax=Tanacetum coccineum TaxID=301880 RepID=A0ABQ5CRG9_9ASTR
MPMNHELSITGMRSLSTRYDYCQFDRFHVNYRQCPVPFEDGVRHWVTPSPFDNITGPGEPQSPPPHRLCHDAEPLPAAASPTADSPGYVHESDPEEDDEDPEEDPADYPTDRDDDDEEEEEPSRDDADDEDEDEEEEEEHPAHGDFFPPVHSFNCQAEITLPPRKRLGIDLGPRYKIGESSAVAATRPVGGRRADYGFVSTMVTEIRRRRAEEVGYGIRDIWFRSQTRGYIGMVAPMNLGGVKRVGTLRSGGSGFLRGMGMLHRGDANMADYQSARSTLAKALKLLKGLQTQMVEFQRQHGPAKGPAQPDAQGRLG